MDVGERTLGRSESPQARSGHTTIAAGERGFQPQPPASTPFCRGGKKRLAASQKTIYNRQAKDGTRWACTAFFPSALADFSFWLGATLCRAVHARLVPAGK
jgi:hypothetical protein